VERGWRGELARCRPNIWQRHVAYQGSATGRRRERHGVREDVVETHGAVDDGVEVLLERKGVVQRERLDERNSRRRGGHRRSGSRRRRQRRVSLAS
jgi:hypothetical protein